MTGLGIAAAIGNRAPLAAGLPTGVYLLFSIKVADQWERVAVLRLGRYSGLRGPGLFHVIPVIDTLSRYVDRRIRVAGVTAESTLTRDTVPVNVDDYGSRSARPRAAANSRREDEPLGHRHSIGGNPRRAYPPGA